MAVSDLTLSIIVVFVFIALYLFNILAVGIQRIKDNWPLYRCQPMVMPFASWFGHNTSQNFSYCIQNIQSNFMSELLKPVTFNIGSLGNVTSGLTSNLNFARGFMSKFRFNMSDIFSNIFATVFNVMIEIQRLVINIKDLFGKLTGVLITVLYVLDGALLTMGSAWSGPPGELIRVLCFHPETKINLKNGEMVPMKDIPLNSILLNGSRVCAVMQISNLDKNGDFVEKMYSIKRNKKSANDAIDDTIIVSGSHLVYEPTVDQFIHVKELSAAKLSDINCPVLYCLITSDHTIQIGDWIFHDWEDSNGSEPKNIGN
jgi:hypothetical protein